ARRWRGTRRRRPDPRARRRDQLRGRRDTEPHDRELLRKPELRIRRPLRDERIRRRPQRLIAELEQNIVERLRPRREVRHEVGSSEVELPPLLANCRSRSRLLSFSRTLCGATAQQPGNYRAPNDRGNWKRQLLPLYPMSPKAIRSVRN